jgi:RNase P/RNase MRP subunit POP5
VISLPEFDLEAHQNLQNRYNRTCFPSIAEYFGREEISCCNQAVTRFEPQSGILSEMGILRQPRMKESRLV